MISIDTGHAGLMCRVVGCRYVVHPLSSDSPEALAETGVARNIHERYERYEHGYVHVVQETKVWSFAQKMTSRGRSLIGRKR